MERFALGSRAGGRVPGQTGIQSSKQELFAKHPIPAGENLPDLLRQLRG